MFHKHFKAFIERFQVDPKFAIRLHTNLQIIKQLHDENPFFLIQVHRYAVS